MTTTYEPNVVLRTGEYNVLGSRPVRHDGADKVTGRAKYGADYQASGTLHGKILRSPHAHANIRSIDTSRAEVLPGVKAIVTAADLPASDDRGIKYKRDNILADRKAWYVGHAVAGVAAVSPHIAEEALDLIEVDYEVLPAVLTAPEAMKDDAPILHDDLMTNSLGEQTDKVSNVAEHFRQVLGDIDEGFAQADEVVEGEFYTKTVHQGYIEPHPCTVLWNEDGRVHVWCSTQGGFLVRDRTAEILGIPVSQVKVTTLEIGGGFGGKTEIYLEPVAAILSKNTGRPVKIVMNRQEVFEGTGPTPGSYIKAKIGATKDGKITAAEAYMAYEAGAFPGSLVIAGAMTVFAAYDVGNAVVDGYDVVVNKPKTAAYRAPGAPMAAFAVEQLIDQLADKVGMDWLDFRIKNASKEGTQRVIGPPFPRIGCVEVLEALKNHPHYSAPLEGENRGRGVAIGFWFNIGEPSACTISVTADGTMNLVEGSADIGGTRTSIAMQAAEVLGVDVMRINPQVVDTDSVGYTAQTDGSRTTFATGWAAYEAAQDVKRQMIERAAQIWDVDADSVEYVDAEVRSKTDSELSMTFADVAEQMDATGGPIVGRASVNPRGVGGSFAGAIADVEVDPETGKVEVLRFTMAQDAGKAIHPSYVEGQMQGGSVQGIGWALNEEYYYKDDGDLANGTFLDYRMPISLDLPMIDTVIVEVPNPGHPFGVRGVGEASIVPPPAAMSNAVASATGVRMTQLPMNPAAIVAATGNGTG